MRPSRYDDPYRPGAPIRRSWREYAGRVLFGMAMLALALLFYGFIAWIGSWAP
ncbi:MAG: hypothetical protein IID41_12535 [Planctomycetes bacterium]|nr:hypothetical protein [Planctomycetota bacterium]